MTELPKRQLGRTGLQVTMLGYGAMELRGAPRGRDVTDTQAEAILHAVLDAGINYIDTSIDYGVSEERIGRYIADRRSEYYLASKCGCLVGAPPAPRGQTSPHVFTRDNILAGVEQSLAPDADRLSRRAPVPHLAVEANPGGARRPGDRARAQERRHGPAHRHVRHPAQPRGSHRHGRVRCLSDPLLGGRARARGAHRGGSQGGSRHRHSGRRGQGRANRGQARRACNGNGGSRCASTTCSTACRPWSSSCASPSPIRTCTRTSSGRSIPPISGTMSMSCGKAHCRPTCTPKPSAASRRRVQSHEAASQHGGFTL